MVSLSKLLHVAGEELALDARRLAAGVASRALPQNSFSRTRTMLMRSLGLRIGATSLIAGPVHITGSGSAQDLLTIGDGCYITGPLHIDLSAPVRIGARVYLGYEVSLLTVHHELGGTVQRCGRRIYRPICIEDGVWIGSRAVVLPGVHVGEGSVIAAGAVVHRDVPANVLVGGVPARVMRALESPVAGVAGEVQPERLAPLLSAVRSHA
jgi:maltose O-acetyltransferase